MIKEIKLLHFNNDEEILFPCISSNLADTDWRIATSLLRSPQRYYRLALLSNDSFTPINWPILLNGQIAKAFDYGPATNIIAMYPSEYGLPTIAEEFIDKWLVKRPDTVSVEYLEEYGLDYHRYILNTLGNVAHCKICEPLGIDTKSAIKDINIGPEVLEEMSTQLDKALNSETKESLTKYIVNLCNDYSISDVYKFAEWCGEGYIKCGGGWMPKYCSQIKPSIFTTDQLYDMYFNIQNINKWKTEESNA